MGLGRENDIYFKELAHKVVGAAKPKIHGARGHCGLEVEFLVMLGFVYS